MTSISLPDPVVRRPGPPSAELDAGSLDRDLRRRIDGEVRFDAGSRGAYSTDASNYRQVPIGVVVPSTVEAGVAAVEVCRQHGAPVVSRGGGTSLAGQTCNVAVVIDWSKYCRDVVSVDPVARTCIVEPGIVLDELNAQLSAHHLMFGPAAGHARSLHAGRHAWQQLVRSDSPGLRQDGRQRGAAGSPHLWRRAFLGRPDHR